MQMLGNLIFGAVLAAISLGPVTWADACALVDHPLARASALIAAPDTTPLDRAVTSARAALPHLGR